MLKIHTDRRKDSPCVHIIQKLSLSSIFVLTQGMKPQTGRVLGHPETVLVRKPLMRLTNYVC